MKVLVTLTWQAVCLVLGLYVLVTLISVIITRWRDK